MQTTSGRRFYPWDPRPEEIFIEDIAHHLAQENRFGGAANQPYSVAQHSVLVSQVCDPEDALAGLLHDGSEAWFKDLPRGLKRHPVMRPYRNGESRLQALIYNCFGIACALRDADDNGEVKPYGSYPGKPGLHWVGMPRSVRRADEILLATEARDLMGNHCLERWSSLADIEPLEESIIPWPWETARELFLLRFCELGGVA